jgi:DNA-binding transcriptional LysR family regulator
MQDLNDLYLFAAVVTHQGFSPASRALTIPKSKLSKHVARLEERLGVRLIERSTRKFRVTDIGEEFYRHCESVLAGVEAAQAVVARARAEPHGTVRLSAPYDIAQNILSRVLPEFMAAYPLVKVQLNVTNRPVDLIEERVDIALRVRTRLDTDPTLTMKVLGHSAKVLVASPDFVRGNGPITIDTLGRMPTLTLREQVQKDTWLLTGPGGAKAEVVSEPRLCSGDFEVLRSAAIAGLGVTMLPDRMCYQAIEAGELVQVLPEWSEPGGIFHLVFTTRQGLLPAVRALIDHLGRTIPGVLRQCNEELGVPEERRLAS